MRNDRAAVTWHLVTNSTAQNLGLVYMSFGTGRIATEEMRELRFTLPSRREHMCGARSNIWMANELNKISRRMFWIGSAIGIVLVVAAAWSVSLVIEEHAETKTWVAHTRQVIEIIDRLTARVAGAEINQRGYLLTGRESYLQPYHNAVDEIRPLLDQLAFLTRDNPIQLRRTHELKSECETKLAELAETSRLRRERGVAAATAVALTNRGNDTAAKITTLLRDMLAEEYQLLAFRSKSSAYVTHLLYASTVGLFIITAVLSSVVIWLAARVRKLQVGLVTVCAWTKQVRLGDTWVPADVYLEDRFGLRITHGISDGAATKFISEMEAEDKRNAEHAR